MKLRIICKEHEKDLFESPTLEQDEDTSDWVMPKAIWTTPKIPFERKPDKFQQTDFNAWVLDLSQMSCPIGIYDDDAMANCDWAIQVFDNEGNWICEES
jgi:hypothetical protein